MNPENQMEIENYLEPWNTDNMMFNDREYQAIVGDAEVIGKDIEYRFAQRIIACVNACAGIPTNKLTSLISAIPDLLAVAKTAASRYSRSCTMKNCGDCTPCAALKAIAKAEGGEGESKS